MNKLFNFLLCLLFLFSCEKSKKFECAITPVSLPAEDTTVVFVPNAFSPDFNGLNDVFRPYIENAVALDWSIYNNKGELLFQTSELNKVWAPEQTNVGGVELCHYQYTATTAQGNTVADCGDLYICHCIPDGYDISKLTFGDQYDPSLPSPYIRGSSQEEFLPCK